MALAHWRPLLGAGADWLVRRFVPAIFFVAAKLPTKRSQIRRNTIHGRRLPPFSGSFGREPPRVDLPRMVGAPGSFCQLRPRQDRPLCRVRFVVHNLLK